MNAARYCCVLNGEAVWIEADKNKAIERFKANLDERYQLAKYTGIKRHINDSMGLGDCVKKYDSVRDRFVEIMPFKYAYYSPTTRIVEFLSDEKDLYPVIKYGNIPLNTMTATYYYENNIALPHDIEQYYTT